MKCRCCGGDSESTAICTFCDFPITVDNESMIENYRLKKFYGVSVHIKVHNYSYTKDKVDSEADKYLKLADVYELETGETVWQEGFMDEWEIDRGFSLTAAVRRGNEFKETELFINPEKPIAQSRIGVHMEDGFRVRLVFGSDEEKVFSEYVSLR